jgi:hypothetical protein
MENLLKIVEESKSGGKSIPPGIYADYGYGLYQTKNYEEAIKYFEKEKSAWPEAVPLMDRMIDNVRTIMAQQKNGT